MKSRLISLTIAVVVLFALSGCANQTEPASVFSYEVDSTDTQITVEFTSFTEVSLDDVKITETEDEVRIMATVPKPKGNILPIGVSTLHTFTLKSPLGSRQVIDLSNDAVVPGSTTE